MAKNLREVSATPGQAPLQMFLNIHLQGGCSGNSVPDPFRTNKGLFLQCKPAFGRKARSLNHNIRSLELSVGWKVLCNFRYVSDAALHVYIGNYARLSLPARSAATDHGSRRLGTILRPGNSTLSFLRPFLGVLSVQWLLPLLALLRKVVSTLSCV